MYLNENVDFEYLKNYGFKRIVDGSCYEYEGEGYIIFIWRSLKDKTFKYRRLYIEIKDYSMIITPTILLRLIQDKVIV